MANSTEDSSFNLSKARPIIKFGEAANKNRVTAPETYTNNSVANEDADKLKKAVEASQNPARTAIENASLKRGMGNHIVPGYNDAKIVFLTDSDSKKDWHTMTRVAVNPAVVLIPTEQNYGIKISNAISKFSESDAGKTFNNIGKLVSKLDKASKAVDSFKEGGTHNAANAAKMLASQSIIFPKYDPAVSNGVPTISLTNDGFTFNFKMGMFGLYDAFEEVVKPAAALALLSAPQGDGNTYTSPYSTANQVLIDYISAAISMTKNEVNKKDEGSNTDTPAETEAGAKSKVNDAINQLANIYKSIGGNNNFASGKKYVNIYFGRICLKYCAISETQISFDNNTTDEHGCPTSATVAMKFVSSEGYGPRHINRILEGID